jgi:peptidoglycan glycosyltransferase
MKKIKKLIQEKQIENVKQQQNDNSQNNTKALSKIKYVYLVIFAMLIFNLAYFVVFSSDNLVINTYNPRLAILEQNIIRGKIFDRNGDVLAETVDYNGEEHRVYPYKNAFAHIVGYSHQGKTGIEALADLDLLQSNMSIYDQIIFELTDKKSFGNNIVATLDKDLQLKAYELLGNNKGAVVAIEPSTGKILCLVSKPDYDPNELVLNWDYLLQDEANSPLLNRATQGLYPPGSTFKVLTAIEFLKENPSNNFKYNCEGKDDFDGKVIHCYNGIAHGEESLIEAFAVSCNTAFATIGEGLDIDELNKLTEQLLFNKPLPYPLPFEQSSFKLTSKNNSAQKAETVIGQGETLITPLHNALIVSTIANGGILMKPYLIDHIENNKGKVEENYLPNVHGTLLDASLTRIITDNMIEVVKSGTAKQCASDDYQIAGKTGSAENPSGDAHGWFVGFAPAENPQIVIAILVENSGGSSDLAVPMAKKLFDIYLQ